MIHADLSERMDGRREQLWTRRLTPDRFEITCLPFFTHGMLASHLPPWESRNSILFTVHRDQPTLATLDSRAAAIAEIAAHLSGAR
ncbi:hypothetical protein [Streptosporangium subroseum]|uniref:hypothetical protein n=1 Tax=Streptosporangium subroseum TaxID=106412 RepID=UPI00308F415A|nr:hypothetical protein OHB15_27165 [Streptosporangium subroseum]